MATSHAMVPGDPGYTVWGDRSVEFYRDPIEFIRYNMDKYSSRVFQSRILNKSTVFVGSAKGVRDLLNDQEQCLDMGYKAFMHGLYGDNLVFADRHEASRIRTVLLHLLQDKTVFCHKDLLHNLIQSHLSDLHCIDSVDVYKRFKSLCTHISLSLFLGLDVETSQELTDHITELTTTHWHGIISVPLTLNIPLWSSSYKKAVDAKGTLLKIIAERLSKCHEHSFLEDIRQAGFKDRKEAIHHTLVFISALIPKAMASLLTSFILALEHSKHSDMWQKCRENEFYLDDTFLEVQRLWPPFIGGRRLARKDCMVDGFRIPKGHAAIYLSRAANRDPKVFPEAEKFKPERWTTVNKEDRDLLSTYGGGHRVCVGFNMVQRILKMIIRYMVDNYQWVLPDGQSLNYKWLPVARPLDAKVSFTQNISEQNAK